MELESELAFILSELELGIGFGANSYVRLYFQNPIRFSRESHGIWEFSKVQLVELCRNWNCLLQ